jgi:hypothetical protein
LFRGSLADIEELESIRAYDAAKDSGEKAVPFVKATQEMALSSISVESVIEGAPGHDSSLAMHLFGGE